MSDGKLSFWGGELDLNALVHLMSQMTIFWIRTNPPPVTSRRRQPFMRLIPELGFKLPPQSDFSFLGRPTDPCQLLKKSVAIPVVSHLLE
jgi:hypothetical protein